MKIFDIDARRRAILLGLASSTLPTATLAASPSGSTTRLGFSSVAPSDADALRLAPGYRAQILFKWGDPIGCAAGQPVFKADGGNTAEEQALQCGMHNDGMHFFSLQADGKRGLLVLNHEYADEGLLHKDGAANWSQEKTNKSRNAVGVSVVEVRLSGTGAQARWQVVSPSPYARRITLATPHDVGGPAAGHTLLKTADDPAGKTILGTMMNCAQGFTPWGTYLTCEENFHAYFSPSGPTPLTAAQRRYGVGNARLPHVQFEPRFDVSRNPNEAHRFGWVVEIDPRNPKSRPVKRTALGRFKHEAAGHVVRADRRVAFYLTDDEPFEYLYRFVTRDAWKSDSFSSGLLDHGVLSVARFDEYGNGQWMPLIHGQGPLTVANGFADQAAVVVNARLAADLLQATKMDRGEGVTCSADGDVFIAFTNNMLRGSPDKEGPNPANPRIQNAFGHILKLHDDRASPERFRWSLLALAGVPQAAEAHFQGNLKGDAFGAPDNLTLDARGVLWVQTDLSSRVAKVAGLGNNQLLAFDPATGESRRFLVGPVGAEIAGCTFAPDMRTMFVNIQHPGEGGTGNWPDGGRPRSATLAIRADDGRAVGT